VARSADNGDRMSSRHAGAAATAEAFARSLLGGDATAAAAYFAADAQLMTPDGTQVGGRQSILSVLGQLTAAGPELEIRSGRTVIAGPVALCTQFWTRSARTPPSEPFEAAHSARLVLARSEQGWQIVIASPWG
jgi:ketosteroid isomerase-like protein